MNSTDDARACWIDALRSPASTERKDLTELDWSYNPRLPKRDVLELATLKFMDAKEDALLIGPPGTGKSHVAKALALQRRRARLQGHRTAKRITDRGHPRSPRARASSAFRAQIKAADLLVIDDLFLPNSRPRPARSSPTS